MRNKILKECLSCAKLKPLSHYAKDKKEKSGRFPYCYRCCGHPEHGPGVLVKVCRRCGIEKPASCFHQAKDARDRLQSFCKECQNEALRESRARKKAGIPTPSRRDGVDLNATRKVCRKCLVEQDISQFNKHLPNRDNLSHDCKSCMSKASRESYLRNKDEVLDRQKKFREENPGLMSERTRVYTKTYDEKHPGRIAEFRRVGNLRFPERAIIRGVLQRCRKKNIPFDLSLEDIVIPEVCPVLGIRLSPGEGRFCDSSPSIDRVVPELGYVKGNVRIISWRANRLKGDARVDEVEAILRYMKQHETMQLFYKLGLRTKRKTP